MYIVYRITNKINNKIYFGYTCQTLNKRFHGHRYEIRDTVISKSIRKYGYENFSIEKIDVFEKESDAKNREIELIAKYKTNIARYPANNGLNMTDGGEGVAGYRHSKEQKRKWKKERRNCSPTREAILKSANLRRKVVYQFSPEGQFLQEFASAKDVAQEIGCDVSNVSRNCRGIIKTLKGFVFQYSAKFEKRDFVSANHTKIQQIDLKGSVVKTYSSIAEAARTLNIERHGIDHCLMGRLEVFQGFKWKRLDLKM